MTLRDLWNWRRNARERAEREILAVRAIQAEMRNYNTITGQHAPYGFVNLIKQYAAEAEAETKRLRQMG